jgi:hypothetical protein
MISSVDSKYLIRFLIDSFKNSDYETANTYPEWLEIIFGVLTLLNAILTIAL